MKSNRKEEERNEKIIRALMKLPPNRSCINCNTLGPQYVCTNFWTFVCMICSGIHREFTHRVKSISMAKFTKQEVEALQRGGNQIAREMFLKDWDLYMQQIRLPDNSNPDKIRAFIKDVYVNKKYARGRSSDKSPRDIQNLKNHEGERRPPGSYHSFPQGPSHDSRYDGRCYGKQTDHRPDSESGFHEGRISSSLYTPGHPREKIYEDRFTYESSGSRPSDYSMSSAGRQRTASSSSFGSFDSNSVSLKSVNSGSIVDVALEPEHSTSDRQATTCTFPSLPFVNPPMTSSASSLDLFAGYSNQAPWTILPEKTPTTVPFLGNEGWVTFDSPHYVRPASEQKGASPAICSIDEASKRAEGAGTSMHNNSQSWNAFGDYHGKTPPTSFVGQLHNIQPQISIPRSHMVPEVSFLDRLQILAIDGTNSGPSLPFNDVTGRSFPPVPFSAGGTPEVRKSTNPFDLPYDLDSEANDVMLDMFSLKAALRSPQLPAAQLGDLTQRWLCSNSLTQAGTAYMARPALSSPSPSITPPQGPDASLGGNPFS